MALIGFALGLATTIVAVALLAGSVFFLVEVVGAFWGAFLAVRRAREMSPSLEGGAEMMGNLSVSVIIPAHNEETSLGATLQNVQAQVSPSDRVLVVADNCSDKTASLARAAGVGVVERFDETRRGKGYALQFALDHLRAEPPDIVLFLDADCQMAPGGLNALRAAVRREGGPVQALYLMNAANAAPKQAVAAFAWRLMNAVRMRGLDHLFGVTRVTGAGFALPWRLASELDLASGEIVEDLALTIDLVQKRAAPRLAPEAVVTSVFPSGERAMAHQRARWEHGSLRLAGRFAGPLIFDGLRRGDLRAVALGADLAIPPITVFLAVQGFVIVAALIAAGALGVVFGASDAAHTLFNAARLAFYASVITGLAILMAWVGFGREVLPAAKLGAVGAFFLSKARVYGADARASTQKWTRTDRSENGSQRAATASNPTMSKNDERSGGGRS
ncbi:MAG: glycosyltransferase family 2 protein [Pseudomonadota bacterium]